MTSLDRTNSNTTDQSKPTWGPGKNAALSFAAFAVIFGIFAYVERDAGDEHTNAAHEVTGAVKTAVRMADKPAVATATKPAVDPAANTVQAARPSETVAPVTLEVEPAATPRIDARTAARRRRPVHSSSVTVAANAHAAPANGHGSARGRYGDARRHLRTHDLASARTHMDIASGSHPFVGRTGRMQTPSVTRAELESARALAKARICAQIDEWSCVEQNASRVLAIDPENGESRALLGQAIRNRL